MHGSRLSFGKSIVAPAAAILALAGLSACDGSKDSAANMVATNQAAAQPANATVPRDDDVMEADGAMHNEMSGRRGADDKMGGPHGRMPDHPNAMGGSDMTKPQGPDANSAMPMKDDGMPMKDDHM